MSSQLVARNLTRRFLTTNVVRALSTTATKPPTREFKEAHVKETVPKEDYYHGHLMADHLEYLDDMMEKAVHMESSMDALKDTYGKKKNLLLNVKWTDSAEIEALFNQSAEQKAQISKQIADLRSMMKNLKAVYDAPDGTAPDMEARDLKAIEEIIDYAETHENKEAIEAMHAKQKKEQEEARKTMAVDAPDGWADDEARHDMEEVEKIIDYAETHENKEQIMKMHAQEEAQRREAMKTMAVDNPEGIPDDIPKHEMEEIQHIIDVAEQVEDKEAILKMHKEEEEARKVMAVDAPDGRPDGFEKEEMLEVEHIIDDASEVEDPKKIEMMHKVDDEIRKERARDPEHNW